MAKKFTGISLKKINQLLGSKTVTGRLAREAAIALPRAKAIAYSAGAYGTAENLKIRTGTRPGSSSRYGFKRTYARLVIDRTKEVRRRDRGSRLARRQILRRAIRG